MGAVEAAILEQMGGTKKICYRCGSPASTREHVIPRCLYPEKPSAKLLTVPACRHCNNALAKDEEYFRVFVTGQWKAYEANAAARAVWGEKVAPSLRRRHQGLRRELLRRARHLYFPFPQGFTRTAILAFDQTRINRVAEKIVRGLYYHGTQNVMPAETKMAFYWNPTEWAKDIALQAALINVDPQVFSCWCGIPSDAPSELSIWWMLFYRTTMCVVTAEVPGVSTAAEAPPMLQ